MDQPLDLLLAQRLAGGLRLRFILRHSQIIRWYHIAAIHTKAMQQLPRQLCGHDVNELALDHTLNFQLEPHSHTDTVLHGEVFFFKSVEIVQFKGFRCRDIDGEAQKVRQSGGSRAHHLVHDLTDRADGQLI